MQAPSELARIRDEIDEVDVRLIDLMAERLTLALSTLDVKREAGLPPTDGRREAAVVRKGATLAREKGLDPELVRDIFWRLIELSRNGARRPSARVEE